MRHGFGLWHPDDIGAADGDTPFRISIPVWFADAELDRQEDTSLAPQGLIGDAINFTAAAAGDIDWASTGAVFEGNVVVKPYAYFMTSDEAQIPMVPRCRIVTRTTDRISLGRGRFTHVLGLTDLHLWKPNEAANGLDTINSVTIQRGGQYINMPVDPIWMSTLYGRRIHQTIGAVDLDAPTGGIYDAAEVQYLPILTPEGPINHAKLTDVMDAASPLVIEFNEDSVGGASKLCVRELVEMSDERAARMASELYGIAAPSIATKRLRPGTSDAALSASKKVVLPRSGRAL